MYVHHVVQCALTAWHPLAPRHLPLAAHQMACISCHLMTLLVLRNCIAALLPPPPQLIGLADPAIHGLAFSRTAVVWGNSNVTVREHDTQFAYNIVEVN